MIPSDTEVISYLKKNHLVNFSMIAKHFKISNLTVKDLMDGLEKKKLVTIEKFGGSYAVKVKN